MTDAVANARVVRFNPTTGHPIPNFRRGGDWRTPPPTAPRWLIDLREAADTPSEPERLWIRWASVARDYPQARRCLEAEIVCGCGSRLGTILNIDDLVIMCDQRNTQFQVLALGVGHAGDSTSAMVASTPLTTLVCGQGHERNTEPVPRAWVRRTKHILLG